MATIRSTCSECGEEVDMAPETITAYTFEDGRAEYKFACPSCGEQVRKPASDRIISLLKSAGVVVKSEEEVFPPHPEGVVSGDALTTDDLIDFHMNLEEELEQLLGS